MEIEKLVERVKALFASTKDREAIADGLRELGFELWSYLTNEWGKPNPDEEVWAYDKGTPNGQLLVLINWIDGFYWIYERTDRGSIGGK